MPAAGRSAGREASGRAPIQALWSDGAVWGRGASDLKAGICMTLEAVRTLDRAGIEVDPTLLFAFVGDEESGEPGSGVSAGARAFSALIAKGAVPRPDMAIYVEPTMLDVYVAHMGFFLCDIRVLRQVGLFWRAGTWRRCAEGRACRSRSSLAIFRRAQRRRETCASRIRVRSADRHSGRRLLSRCRANARSA